MQEPWHRGVTGLAVSVATSPWLGVLAIVVPAVVAVLFLRRPRRSTA